ncbi:MAG: ATP-binding protein [Oscillospiraceae bacterium]|nr:ATP-binding protein [Oscillospiraceae bacterium]
MYRFISSELQAEVKNESDIVSSAINMLEDDDERIYTYVSAIGRKSENRITLISSDGTVVYDNYSKTDNMENHLDRPEIAQALSNGVGTSVRASDTLGEKTYYYAVKLESGDIIRIADTTKSALGILGNLLVYIVLTAVVIFIISAFIAAVLTKEIIKPINLLDLDEPVSNNTYDELSSLLTRMDKQNKRINKQIETLSSQKAELSYITENMSEGLVIFGNGGVILSANTAAKSILGSNETASYTHLCRDKEYLDTVESVLDGKKCEATLEKNGRIYRLAASPVTNMSEYSGVLFIMDITDRENAEQLRREFSANVSHELKTPLTSIMGAAEIIANGIVKPEDIKHFAEKIYSEGKRLLALIEDIIKVSRLDEGKFTNEFGDVSLYRICQSIMAELKEKAENRNVNLSGSLDDVTVCGIESVLYEMVYNLCDNAISYNKDNGKAELTLKKTENGCVVTVSDNGIGIPKEHQTRIFERFYRVDKSHSKGTGGTGLGLSIVKHAAVIHGGEISLESEVGKGTVISVTIPNRCEQLP